MKTKLLLNVGLVIASNAVFAQDKWDTDGNMGVGNNAKIGTKNNKGYSIITNNQPAVDVTNTGTFNFLKPVNFTNKVKFDSVRILRYLDVDSIHCRTIKIGNSWTMNDAGTSYGGFRPFNQQLQNASDNNHVFEGARYLPFNATNSDNVKVTIGYLNTSNGPQHKLNVHSNFNNDVFSSFTNRNSYGIPSSFSATDGFKIGILANGTAQLNQQENLDMQFYTNNLQRAIILANGRFGINASTPLNRFEVTSAATDFGGGNVLTPGGSSGIRTTNMTASTPITIGNGKVVSVNANGDFILVKDDNSGTGGGTATAQNGLNHTVGAPFIELGGNLIRHTDVVFNNFNQSWKGSGSFLVTDYASGANSSAANASGIYK